MTGILQSFRGRKLRSVAATLCVSLVPLISGCSHALEVKNLGTYQSTNANSFTKRVAVGVIPVTPDLETAKLVKAVGTEMSKYGAEVVLPYLATETKPVDIIATIGVTPRYEGSGWNFLINFPGFLIFTPAWHGYIYDVSFDVDVTLARGSDKAAVDTFKIPFKLDVRHSAMNRTWTEISWFEVGIIALVSGIVFTSYDPYVTQPTVEKSSVTIGDFIAQEIITRVNTSTKLSGARSGQTPVIAISAR